MAASLGVASRFAVLKVEDDEDGETNDWNIQKKGNKQSQQAAGTKKKKPKKKKQAQQNNLVGKGYGDPVDWNQWMDQDKQFVSETFEQDMQRALTQSKLQYEKDSELKDSVTRVDADGEAIKGKKRKQKMKTTISLDAFNQSEEMNASSQANGGLDDFDVSSMSKPSKPPSEESQSEFFGQINKDVRTIIQKEKIQEEYQKQYIAENIKSQQHKKNLDVKDKEICFLKATLKKMEVDLKQVKQRNKQLCFILGQGEMKEKADILLQVDELTQVKDELTNQVTELHAEIEKDRSRFHAIKIELDKLKGSSKHSGK